MSRPGSKRLPPPPVKKPQLFPSPPLLFAPFPNNLVQSFGEAEQGRHWYLAGGHSGLEWVWGEEGVRSA